MEYGLIYFNYQLDITFCWKWGFWSWNSFWQALQLCLPSSFFDELLFNSLDSIDCQSFKVADLLKKEWQRGKQNRKKTPTVSKFSVRFVSRSATLKLCQSIESSVFNNNSSKKEEGGSSSFKQSNSLITHLIF